MVEMEKQTIEVITMMFANLQAQANGLTPNSKKREYESYRDNVLHFKKVFAVFNDKVVSDCDRIVAKINNDWRELENGQR